MKWVRTIGGFPLLPVAVYLLLFFGLNYFGTWFLFVAMELRLHGLLPMLINSIMQFSVSLLLLYLMRCLPDGRTLAAAGFDSEKSFQDVIVGFVLGVILVSLMVACLYCFGIYKFVSFSGPTDLFLPLAIFFFDAFSEEVIFRAYIFQTVEKRWGTRMAILVSSAIFGIAHMINPINGATTIEKAFGCFCLILEAGLILSAAYLVRRTLWLPLGLHWAWNFCEGPVYGTIVSGTNICKPIIEAQLVGSFLATGGMFGPEASLSGLVVGTLAGLAMLTYAVKRGRFADWQQHYQDQSAAADAPNIAAAGQDEERSG